MKKQPVSCVYNCLRYASSRCASTCVHIYYEYICDVHTLRVGYTV